MERGSKRKAVALTPSASEARVAKRARTPQPRRDGIDPASPHATRDLGLRFVEQLKHLCDKSGRVISTAFLTLPDRADLPDYYDQIALPIAIDTIEAKLKRGEYESLSAIESDAKRMVANAKAYNEVKSEIYADAERIRKMTSNFMVKSNPAYKDPNYVAFATPLPERAVEDLSLATTPAATIKVESRERRMSKAATSPPRPSRRSASGVAADVPDADEATMTVGYEGKTFQQAQEQLIAEMINYEDDGGLDIFSPFVNLPPRSLTDYYAVIKNPLSLKGIQKKIRGYRGRTEITGVSEYKTWDALEAEVRRIADNAREYNEDGSDIHVLAGELEDTFKAKLAEVKAKVEEPTQPTLKLKMSGAAPPIKLKLGSSHQNKSSSAGVHTGAIGVTVDQAALQRQRELVQAGVNGHASMGGRASMPEGRGGQKASTPPRRAPSEDDLAPTPLPVADAVKSEATAGTHGLARSGSNVGMSSVAQSTPLTQPIPPPPSFSSGIRGMSSGSPQAMQAIQPQQQAATGSAPAQPYFPHATHAAAVESKWRSDENGIAEALMSSLELTSDPSLALPTPFRVSIPPDPVLSQTSLTLALPASHHYLLLEPRLAPTLADGRRPYKLFITVNGMRVQQTPQQHLQQQQTGGEERRRLLFQLRLQHGMNRVEVECVAAAAPGQGFGAGPELEVEKTSLFVFLTR